MASEIELGRGGMTSGYACVCFSVTDSNVYQCNGNIRKKFKGYINSLHFKRNKCREKKRAFGQVG